MSAIAPTSLPTRRTALTLGQVRMRWVVALAVVCGAIVVFFPFFNACRFRWHRPIG